MGGGERRGEVEGEEVVGRRPFSEGGFGEQSGEEKLPPERVETLFISYFSD